MKIKTSELTSAALNWAVAKADGREVDVFSSESIRVRRLRSLAAQEANELPRPEPYCSIPGIGIAEYDRNWAQGGPIIEREGISLRPIVKPGHALDGQCLATVDHGNTGTMVQWVKRADWPRHYWKGPTPLIAAMRCFVASKLGGEVDVPEMLL